MMTTSDVPKPPSLHWVLVLALAVVTFGLFSVVWMFVQARWVMRFDAKPKAIYVLAIGVPVIFAMAFLNELALGANELVDLLGNLIALAVVVTAYFDMRAAIEAKFNLNLSGPMTFFFNVLYLQYHMRLIAKGEHVPYSQNMLNLS
jgi:hypothetical protein